MLSEMSDLSGVQVSYTNVNYTSMTSTIFLNAMLKEHYPTEYSSIEMFI